ncbi:helix-turn-helix domain-containing protein [Niveispirillum sp. SYP-B3756]|uniref:IclR family transcriptional regulator n=1 Tax=Niveispirillum sp. SYP-B3756 TaxID=2662178 RepID=UPI001291D39F|nr:IclR family transcriptional regulator [Niveispirillum sp. SYP-B3756]MQP68074.1 helix-turn-helix domain-containing protein [Niveispirillum sp. SYP-B3756]
MSRPGLKGTYAAPALEKAFEILELLADRPGGMQISEMSAILGRSVGELFRIVIVMEMQGYLQKSETTDRYTVAYKLLDVALRATPSQNLIAAALMPMERLAATVGQSCHLVVANGGQGLVIARQENPGTRGFALKVGAAVNLLHSCSGHVLLAFAPPARTAHLIERAEATQGVGCDRAALAQTLANVREQGFDSRKSPVAFGVTDISLPIFGFNGDIMAALTIPFMEMLDGSQKVGLAAARQELGDTAKQISAALGHQA